MALGSSGAADAAPMNTRRFIWDSTGSREAYGISANAYGLGFPPNLSCGRQNATSLSGDRSWLDQSSSPTR